MANLTRLSVLIGETDADRSRETAELLKELGVGRVVRVGALAPLLLALKKQAFDVLICAEQLGGEDGVSVLRAARKVAPATRTVLMRRNDRAGEFVPEDIEALELPFSRLTLQGLLHRTASTRGGLWCEVPELSLSDILQMYHQARRTITVLLSGPIAGRIQLEGGEIVDAEAGEEHGMAALSRLLEAESGLVRTEPPTSNVAHTISAPFQSVVLEAAHKLDERRRDSMAFAATQGLSFPPGSSIPPSSAPVPGTSTPGAFGASGSGAHGFDETRVSGGVLRPALTPPVQGPAPHPESFLAPNRDARQRQTLIAVVSVLASLLFLGVAALYFKGRLDGSEAGQRDGVVDAVKRVDAEPSSQTLALRPASDMAASSVSAGASSGTGTAARAVPPVSRPAEPAVGEEGGGAQAAATEPARPVRAEPDDVLRQSGNRTLRRPASNASRFELHITSKPARATVTEAGRVLGKTPLTLTIDSNSVANAARDFVVQLPGYFPVKITRGPSEGNVTSAIVLYPRPAAAPEDPDGGQPEEELESARPGTPRSPRQQDLGIRLRR